LRHARKCPLDYLFANVHYHGFRLTKYKVFFVSV
jgi:hypothetical protein